jgi:hypothetical protein
VRRGGSRRENREAAGAAAAVSLKKLTVPERKQDLTDLAPQGDFISAQAIEHIVGQIDDPQRTTPACAACDVICSGTVPDFRSVPVENLVLAPFHRPNNGVVPFGFEGGPF